MAAAGGAPAGAGTASAAEPVLRKDCSRALKIPFLPATAPAAPQPDNIRLPLYDYQRRSVARMQTIEAYTQGTIRALSCPCVALALLLLTSSTHPCCDVGLSLCQGIISAGRSTPFWTTHPGGA